MTHFLITFTRFGESIARKLVEADSLPHAQKIARAMCSQPRLSHTGLGATGYIVAQANLSHKPKPQKRGRSNGRGRKAGAAA